MYNIPSTYNQISIHFSSDILKKKLNMKIPVFLIDINLDDETSGMGAISFVEDPAIESNFICFSKDNKPMMFQVENEMEHKVTGCAIWCDKPIYRYSPEIGEYYVVFNKETIDKIVHKYAKQGLNNLVDLQHNGEMIDGVVMVEYFIKDTEKGINPKGFEDIDDGSLFVTYKIEDEKLWNEIVSPDSEFKGFSIEINADIVPTNEYVEEDEYEDADLWNWLEELMKALEDADCEIVMSQDKKKSNLVIEDEPDDNEGDGWDYLNFEVERTDVAKAVDQKKAVLIDGKVVWVHSLGKRDGNDVAVIYDPKNDRWRTIQINKIKTWEPTKNNIGEFPDVPKSITEDEEITIQRTINTGSYSDLIHNRVPVQISYNDELPNPHTGFRQCAIIAYGLTKRGNECIRVMETFGDSRSAAEGTNYIPNYRLMLTRRCVAFKPMVGVEKWGMGILDSRVNWNGDKSMSPCYDHIELSDFND